MNLFKKESKAPTFTVRPIAYRAWDGKKMVSVQSLCWNAAGIIWYGSSNQFGWAWISPEFKGWDENNLKPSENDICPIMQWTGLKTKGGQDIWEGDIIDMAYSDGRERDSSRDILGQYEVTMARSGEWRLEGKNLWSDSNLGESLLLCAESLTYHKKGWGRFEVIGNIHENPELLRT